MKTFKDLEFKKEENRFGWCELVARIIFKNGYSLQVTKVAGDKYTVLVYKLNNYERDVLGKEISKDEVELCMRLAQKDDFKIGAAITNKNVMKTFKDLEF